jgi:hypothetical protein
MQMTNGNSEMGWVEKAAKKAIEEREMELRIDGMLFQLMMMRGIVGMQSIN